MALSIIILGAWRLTYVAKQGGNVSIVPFTTAVKKLGWQASGSGGRFLML